MLVMPSKWEGFGLVALEAMCLGVPVICSGVGGLHNIVTEDCGRICVNVSQYTKEMKRILADHKYLEMYKEGAMKQADRFDNLNEYIDKIKDMYGGLKI